MKTRIISAAVMIALVIGVLTVGKLWFPLIITIFLSALSAAAVFELLNNVVKIKPKILTAISCVYAAEMTFLLDKSILNTGNYAYADLYYNNSRYLILQKMPVFITVIYVVIAVFTILSNHKEFSLDGILGYVGFPLLIAYGFSCLNSIISYDSRIYYLLLLVNFASICDTGAYFVGSFFGKRKLCPEISPKKTVEGAIGGIVSSIIVSVILVLCFGSQHILWTLLLTIPLCIVGMMGDLFASAIKRTVGLKDYSNLIPGHGGILDRFDSMLLIAPVLYMFMEFGVI